eukprot:tig00000350_g24321.t1
MPTGFEIAAAKAAAVGTKALAAGAKVPAFVASYWKDIGGAAFAFHVLKGFIFGKGLRTIEFPNGEMKTVMMRWPTLSSLKKHISLQTPGLTPEEIRAVCRWIPPHFCEPVKNSTQVRYLTDDSWIVWTRAQRLEIPLRLSLDKGFPIDDPVQAGLMRLLEGMHFASDGTTKMNPADRDDLVLMATSKDEGLLGLYRNYGNDPEQFERHTFNYLEKRRAAEKERQAAERRKAERARKKRGATGDEDEEADDAQKDRKDREQAKIDSVISGTLSE